MVSLDIGAISLHPEITPASQTFFKKIKRFLLKDGIPPLVYASVNTPFIVSHGHQYQLLSHHFVYLLVKGTGARSFLAREATLEQINDILAIDQLNVALLERALSGKKDFTSQTQSHRKRRLAQQVCPLCPGLLIGQKSKKGKIKEDGKEYFEVKCHYRHYSRYRCEFFVELEKSEYILFKNNKYPTSKWLIKLNTKCPHCKDILFERKMPDGKIFHQCYKTLTRHYPGDDDCNYKIEITDEKRKH